MGIHWIFRRGHFSLEYSKQKSSKIYWKSAPCEFSSEAVKSSDHVQPNWVVVLNSQECLLLRYKATHLHFRRHRVTPEREKIFDENCPNQHHCQLRQNFKQFCLEIWPWILHRWFLVEIVKSSDAPGHVWVTVLYPQRCHFVGYKATSYRFWSNRVVPEAENGSRGIRVVWPQGNILSQILNKMCSGLPCDFLTRLWEWASMLSSFQW